MSSLIFGPALSRRSIAIGLSLLLEDLFQPGMGSCIDPSVEASHALPEGVAKSERHYSPNYDSLLATRF